MDGARRGGALTRDDARGGRPVGNEGQPLVPEASRRQALAGEAGEGTGP